MKICGKCKVQKELVDFHNSKITKDKLHKWCKPCLNKYNLDRIAYRKQNGPTVIRQSKVCKRCSLEKPINQFHRKTGYSADGYGAFCKPCWVKEVKFWAHRRRYKNG